MDVRLFVATIILLVLLAIPAYQTAYASPTLALQPATSDNGEPAPFSVDGFTNASLGPLHRQTSGTGWESSWTAASDERNVSDVVEGRFVKWAGLDSIHIYRRFNEGIWHSPTIYAQLDYIIDMTALPDDTNVYIGNGTLGNSVHFEFRANGDIRERGGGTALGKWDGTDPRPELNLKGNWRRIKVTIDLPGQKYDLTIGGVMVGTDLPFRTGTSGLDYIRFFRAKTGASDFSKGYIGFDNVYISTEPRDDDDMEPPSVPTDVQATAQSETSIQVTWTASTDNVEVAGYNVFRNGNRVGITDKTSYLDTGLLPDTTYSYTVSAFDVNHNESEQSPAAIATTYPIIPEEDWYCSIDLGSTDVVNFLTHPQYSDGNTTDIDAGGLNCRRPVSSEDHYFYFAIDDDFLYDEPGITTYLEVCYYDDQINSAYLFPQYDAIGEGDENIYRDASPIYFTNTGEWKTATWTLTECKFANRQSAGADFKIYVGPYNVKIDSVRVSTEPFTDYTKVERDLGDHEIYRGLSHPNNWEGSDGKTIVVDHAGRSCRRAQDSGDDYFYFNVSDAIMYDGDPSTVYLKVECYDSPGGVITPEYDSQSSAYTSANTLNFTGTNTWKTHTWTLTDCKFANRQHGSGDFRLYVGNSQDVYIDKVTVSKVPFGPAAPTVTYPYGMIDTLTPTISWIAEAHIMHEVVAQAVGEPAHQWDSGTIAGQSFSALCGQLLPDRTYHARVRLADNNDWSDWSDPIEFSTPGSPYIRITSPADVTALNDRRPTIRWEISSAQSITNQTIRIDDGEPVSLSTGVRTYRTDPLETGLHAATIQVIETGGGEHEKTVRFWVNATPAEEGTLYVFDLSFLKNYSASNLTQRRLFYDTCHVLGTLQGIVNRNSPRLFYRYFGVDQTWQNILTDSDNGWLRSKTIVNIPNLSTLISTFRDDINGVVEYDPNVWATSNVASTIAGVEDIIAIRKDTASGSLYRQLVVDSSGPQLPVVESLVGLFTGTGTIPGTDRPSTGSKKCDAYIWAKIHYLDTGKCNPRRLAYWLDSYWLQKPYGISTPEHLLFNHDYIVANRGFIFDLNSWGDEKPVDDPNQPLGTDLATKKEILLSAYNAAGGEMIHVAGFTPWWFKYTDRGGGTRHPVHTEWEFVKIASAYNAFVDADATGYSDMLNASIFMQFPLPDRLVQNPKPTLRDMRRLGYMDEFGGIAPFNFIYFYIGDYDSAAWIDRLAIGYWNNSDRGKTPMGWAFNPNLIDRHAVAFDYFYRTKSDQDYFIAGDSGAGYVNPPNIFPPRDPSGLPSGAEEWIAHNEPYYRQMDYSITGFLINGFCGRLNPTMELMYRSFSGDGIMTQPAWMHADSHLEENMPVALQKGDLPVSNSQMMADAVHPHGVAGETNFLSFRTIIRSPSHMKGTIEILQEQHPDMNYRSVEPYTYFYMLRHHLGGHNNSRATYTFDTIPEWAAAGDQFAVQFGVRNDGWNTWYAEGPDRTVLAVNMSADEDWADAVIVPLPRDIAPGEGEILTAELTVVVGGLTNIAYQMRTGDTGWFADAGDLSWQSNFLSYADVDNIAAIRAAPDGTHIMLTNMPVTAGTAQFASRAYIETPERTWGIRINTDELLDIGDVINVRGEIHTSATGERYILPHEIWR